MKNNRTGESACEVSGAVIVSCVSELKDLGGVGLRILQRHGIEHVDPHGWYPFEAWLECLRYIGETAGPATLRTLGRRVPSTAQQPMLGTLEEALERVDEAVRQNYRGNFLGHYRYERTGGRTGRIFCDTVSPCEFVWGMLEGAGVRFARPGEHVRVEHDETQPCKSRGSQCCCYLVSW